MSDALTPMMAQYRRLRSGLPADTILFFRLGDFYEMFHDDAVRAAPILDIALTRRQSMPMCGVPYHAAEAHIARLLRAGMKVAVCDQMEDPSKTRGLVRRDITRVVTPGAVVEEGMLDTRTSNYLASIHRRGGAMGVAVLELSTGAFWIEERADAEEAGDLLARVAPSEIILPDEQREAIGPTIGRCAPGAVVTPVEGWRFEPDAARDALLRHFGALSLEGFGCEAAPAGVGAAGAALHYVTSDLRRSAAHIRGLQLRTATDFVALDDATVGNLEVAAPRGGGAGPCLLKTLDTTRTPMGGRMIREWLLRPLGIREAIVDRHDAVAALIAARDAFRALRDSLGGIRDMERLLARIGAGGGNARDLRAIAQSLARLPGLREEASLDAPLLRRLADRIEPLPDLADRIERAIVDEPPATTREGGMIRPGIHAELDELRSAAASGRSWIARFQASEQQRAGIKSLKIRHNKVFGYYIEITRAHLANVPPDYVRKQTMVNGERFVTPELKEYENRILGAQERSVALEAELFIELCAAVLDRTDSLMRSAAAVAEVDALASFAERAMALDYCRPVMTGGDAIRIRDGRHPVIETLPDAERFVPNDTWLDGDTRRLAILTGPNMAGKSTYIRQVALITLMAHAGSFVPAAEAEICAVDRIFTRVGAGDDLARGRSTFMVEMQETANILNNATSRSLIVLDEIGRGTSTFDGISLAWAVAEHLHNDPGLRAKTLFATHYHELTDLALTLPGVKNFNVLVRESGDRIAFLRKIVPGAADKSYGIHVARLAGMPAEVVDRAKEILANLEEGEFGEAGQPKIARRRPRRAKEEGSSAQMTLF